MTKEFQTAAIQRDVDAARVDRDLVQCLGRLEANPDFVRLISQGYFRNEAVRLVHLRSEPDACEVGINKQMDAIAGLSGYFRQVRQKGEMADKAIRDGESLLIQLETED